MAEKLIPLLLLAIFLGCTKSNAPSMPPSQPAPVSTKTPSFVPPTAEEAYRLQDDCTRRGEIMLRENVVGSALTHEQVSRYSPTTNRCYVRLEVHAKNLDEWFKYDSSIHLYDGQTKELLASVTHKPDHKDSYVGFGCSDVACVESKIGECMSGKDCEPE